MKGWLVIAIVLAASGCATSEPTGAVDTVPSAAPDAVAFTEATLIIETNATDGDAGLQLFLDHDAWKSIRVYLPDGRKILDVSTPAELEDYGLTELFSESSEPPFDEFPFSEFRRKFPAGDYTFVGETIDGEQIRSTVPLSHDVPDGPEITSPQEEATVAPGELVVAWEPVTGQIARYEVVVEHEAEPVRTFKADLPPDATRLDVPAGFTSIKGTYKTEVVAKADNGNQTLTEVEFEVA